MYPAQGPGGETSVEARKGHHAHATTRQRLALADAHCGNGGSTMSSDGAGSECGDGLELEPAGFSLSLSKLPYTPHKTNVGGI